MSIVVTHCNFEGNTKESVLKLAKPDGALKDAIAKVASDLNDEGIEIYHQQDNILITEKGYYMTFFERDLVKNQ